MTRLVLENLTDPLEVVASRVQHITREQNVDEILANLLKCKK